MIILLLQSYDTPGVFEGSGYLVSHQSFFLSRLVSGVQSYILGCNDLFVYSTHRLSIAGTVRREHESGQQFSARRLCMMIIMVMVMETMTVMMKIKTYETKSKNNNNSNTSISSSNAITIKVIAITIIITIVAK